MEVPMTETARKMLDRAKALRLLNGEKFSTYSGRKDMEPRLGEKQIHTLSPAVCENCIPGDIVFCLIDDKYYTALALKKDKEKGLLIANNHGIEMGWTKIIFGKVTQIF